MIDYSINEDENILYCNISGETNSLYFTNYINRLVNDAKYHMKLNAIINISENTNVSYEKDGAWIGSFFTQYLMQRENIAWAFVTPSNLTMGLVRLIMERVDTSSIDVAYFSTEAEAKNWIAERVNEKNK